MNKAQLPGYVRCYTGPATDIAQEQQRIIGLRRIVIHRRVAGLGDGGTNYAVHEESNSGVSWHLYWGDYNLTWMGAIERAQQREDQLLGTPIPVSQSPDTRQIHWPNPTSVANHTYKLTDQPTADTYIELSVTVGGTVYSGKLYRTVIREEAFE